MKHLRILQLLLALLCIPCMALSQTTIFSETFDESNGATSGTSAEGVAWNSVCPGCAAPDDIFAVNNGTLTADDTNDAATWTTDPIDISNCTSISVSMDYSGDSYPATGDDALESSSENCVGSTGPCPGDPSDWAHPNCTCWDFASFDIIIDGVNTNIELIGTDYIPMSALIEFPPACTDNANAIIEVTMRTTGGDEEMMFDNVVMLCWQEPVAEALDTDICAGESINLSENTADAVSWSWTGPSGASPNNPWNIPNASAAEAGSYTVVTTDENACLGSDQIAIVVNTVSADWLSSDLTDDVCEDGTCIEIELELIGDAPFDVTFDATVLGITNTNTLTFEAGENILTACLDYTAGGLFDPVNWVDSDNSVHVWPGVASLTNMGSLTIDEVTDANGCTNTTNSATFEFTIIPEETPSFMQVGPYCNTENINVSLPNVSDNGINGSWSPSNMFNPSTLGVGDHIYTFTPDMDECASETSMTIVVDDCSCSITSADVTNIVCQSDGLLTFDVTVEGTNVGSGWGAVDSDGDAAGTGTYGVPVEMGPYFSSGFPSLMFTIEDFDDPSCTFDIDVPVPAECFCDIEFSGMNFSALGCNDNGTPGDPTDDYIVFEINPTGVGLGTSYTISPITTIPPGGTYGAPQIFQTLPGSAGGGGMIITVNDDTYPLCVLQFWLPDPGTCSDACDISVTSSMPMCDDNGTTSDPSDDTFSFDLNVTGINTGSSWTADDPLSTSGTYGVDESFSGFPISGGDVTITITDNDDPSCTEMITIPAPTTCSTSCNITAVASIADCDDNGTPSDPSDDTFFFDLNVTGVMAGAGWTANDPMTTSGVYGVDETLSGFPISGGDVIITIVDNDDPTCTDVISVSAPLTTCSDLCVINITASIPMCDDNGTPSDPSDDTFSFDLNATGLNTGSSWTADDPLITSGTYGVDESFSGFPISGGDVTITIMDDDDPLCTEMITIIAPTTCSTDCDITAVASEAVCDDNGTPSDPSDDTFSFDLNVTGLLTGAGWTANDPMATTGVYGVDETLSGFPISGGDVIITIVDIDDLTCTDVISVSAPLTTCSELCVISAIASTPMCDDNGTPSDPSDDTFSFDLNVTGSNTGSSWTADDPLNTSGTYGVDESFSGFPISGGDVTITIVDDTDPLCTYMIIIPAPAACSNDCDISAVVSAAVCNDNGTPSDPSDDTFSFDVNVTGFMTGAGWTANDPMSTTGVYGVDETISGFPISGGDVLITIMDNVEISCIDIVSVAAPTNTCSNLCALSIAASTPMCDDNGTPSDPSDDTFSFDLNVTGANTGLTWTANDPSNTSGSYGVDESFSGFPISGGDLIITITDDDDPLCTNMIIIPAPTSCSNTCDITAVPSTPDCDDNGTPSDPSDDTFSFDLNVTGLNTGSGWTANDPMNTTGTYGVDETLSGFPISGGTISITVSDNTDPTCNDVVMITAPPSCSNLCDIVASASIPMCNDNGTPSDPSDDTFSFDLNVTGVNTGSGWTANDPMSTTGSYGVDQTLSGFSISGGSVSITVTDDNDPACTAVISVDPPMSCSNTCNIEVIVGAPSCNNEGTPSDDTDDTFYFDVTVTGSNTGASWIANDINNSSGMYGVVTNLGPFDISSGPVSFTITDIDDNACVANVMVTEPSSCSTTCSISNSIIETLCSDNGTPSDPSDDTYTVEILVTGLNLGGGWTADDPLASSGLYGVNEILGPYNISDGPIVFTITDDTSPGCSTVATVSIPMTCSNLCDISAVASIPMCDDNGTPSDPTDDTYSFDVTVTGLNTGASWVATDPSMTSGSYGSAQTFGPYLISGGATNFTITDNIDGSCQTSVMVSPPPSCSNLCDIDATVGMVSCNDNNTPSDPSDDTFSFELVVTGANTATMWNSDDPAGITGAYGAIVVFGPYAIADGAVTINIFDDTDGLCTAVVNVTPPSTCSDLCAINAVPTAAVCDDNNTPSDPDDDTFSFDLVVTGSNTGLSWSATDPLMTSGAYGSSVSFGPYPISGGDLVFNITDIDEALCATTVNITAPMTCSNLCVIEYTVTNIVCNNNNTPSDDTDDNYSFDIEVNGSNTASTWSANDPLATTGAYGVITSMGPYPISNGTINFTITDASDMLCTADVMVDAPATCSTTCSISNTIGDISCLDNNTVSDPSDDMFTVEIVVSGLNVGTAWTANDPLGTNGLYGVSTILGPYPISGGPINVIITDDIDDMCTTELTLVPPMTCSDVCTLEATVSAVSCDDNNTPSDPSDDLFTFDLFVDGMNIGSSWSSNDPNMNSGSYGGITSFGPFLISDGDLGFTITDGVDPSCTFFVNVAAPMSCSDLCDLEAMFTNIMCNDANTPSDPTDDTFSFEVEVTGSNVATNWVATDPNATSGPYDMSIVFGPYPISGGAINFDIIDAVDGNCLESLSVLPPMSCSDVCDIVVDLATAVCDDNGTPADASDDVFSFDVTVTGNNVGGSWSASDPNATSGAYNSTVSFGPYPISGGDINFTITDGVSPGCTEIITVMAPLSCSNACAIDVVVSNILCDANGTPSDDTDDLYTFDVVVTGFNTSGSWSADEINGATGNYNTIVSFGPYNISDGNQNFTITDASNSLCTANVTVLAPNTCSTTCSITNLVDNITCDDNGTPSDPTDDLFFFDLVVTGSNIGNAWTADDPLLSTGLYGVTVPMGPYEIANGTLNFTITDDIADPSCTTIVSVIPPMSCSDLCDIEAVVSSIVCNDNNTPSDPSDDSYSFDVLVTGLNTGTTWSANDPNAVSGAYEALTSFGPYLISDGDQNFTITDGNSNSCSVLINVATPMTCSDVCALEITEGLVVCSDNGTPSDASDDTYSFDLLVTGSNVSGSWTANDPNGTTGIYDVTEFFGPYPISGGDQNFTITDMGDINCVYDLSIIAPATCSDLCEINAMVSNVSCADNGTPSDPSDDVFTFDVFVTGFNTSNSWSASDPNATSGAYDAIVTLGPYPISGGNINFTITDAVENACTVPVMVSAPASCSNLCDINYTANNILCNDNGTPSDDSDDTYTFDIVVTGLNTALTWSANDPNFSSGNYNETITLGPYPISNGNQNFVITDTNDPMCTATVLVQAPSACSVSCSISNTVSNITCSDNGTPSDPTDDIYFFDILVVGSNIGSSWSANDPFLISGLYNNLVPMGPYLISDGILNFTVTDDANPDCTTIVSVEPPIPCSDLCSLEANVISVSCDDNGTPSDASDDLFSFIVIVEGENAGTTWSANDPNATSGSYGNSISFGPYLISDGDLNFTITDGLDMNCSTSVGVEAPAPCSDACAIDASLISIACNDNGTPSDPSDDTYMFDVLVEGTNASLSWIANDPNGTTGNMGEITSFGPYLISDGDLSLDIEDATSSMCLDQISIEAPLSCSDLCVIEAIVSNINCDDNGTSSESTDDVFSFDLIVSGDNIGAGWEATDPNTTNGNYDITSSFGPYPISGGDLSFVITDAADPSCVYSVLVEAPPSCSNACEIEYVLSNVLCNNNNTPSDNSDDTYTFDLFVTGTNASGMWTASDPNLTSGSYGTVVSFGPYAIVDGNQNFLISDVSNSDCSATAIVIAPDACSTSCSLTNIVSNVTCDPNNTPSEGSDDLYYFDLEITGSNLGTAWVAGDPNGSMGQYNSISNLGPYAISDGILNFVVEDVNDPDCSTIVSVTPPSACSDVCLIEMTISNYSCDDNGTSLDPSDDLFSFDVFVEGMNVGSSWTADDPNNSSGSYNTLITMGPYLIANGDFNFIIEDGVDDQCSILGEVVAPPSCSNDCALLYTSTNLVCNDNGTVNNTADDTYTFDLLVTGTNVNSTSWIATDMNSTTGDYGVLRSFGPFLISDGDAIFNVIDANDPACSVQVQVEVPTDCIDPVCSITTQNMGVVCDDNGTPNDGSDDTFTLSLFVDGMNTGSSWIADDPNMTTGIYGSTSIFGPYAISNGDLNFNIIDANNLTCSAMVIVEAPSDCSQASCMIDLSLGDVSCDNMGTTDPSDDTYQFDVVVTGTNIGTNWIVDDPSVASGLYGSTVLFGPYLISDGNVSLLFTDSGDSACNGLLIVNAPNACSTDCLQQVEAGQSQTLSCDNALVNLVGESIDGGNPSWLDESGAVLANGLELEVTEEGTYYFEVLFDDGCSAIDSVVINSNVQIPFISLEQSPFNPCVDENFVLDASASDMSSSISYEWFGPDGSLLPFSEALIEVNVEGWYYLESFDSANGCSNLDSVLVEDLQIALPEANASYTAISDSTFQFDIFSDVTIVEVLWSNSELLSCSNCLSPIATLSESANFTIEISYDNGCTDILTLFVPIDQREEIFIPSIFSPNGDGSNDIFFVQSAIDRTIKEFIIYDRWGNRVMYRQNIVSNDPAFGWAGDWNGEQLNPGVYVYYLVIENVQGEEQRFFGDISILR